jgi:hypothetical protein
VKGKHETILLFEVLDGEPPGQREKKISYRSEMARALRSYYGKDFPVAYKILLELLKVNPEDEILRLYRKRCELLINIGVPEGWQGVEEIYIK